MRRLIFGIDKAVAAARTGSYSDTARTPQETIKATNRLGLRNAESSEKEKCSRKNGGL